MATEREPQMGDVAPFIEALTKVKADRDALLAALRDVAVHLAEMAKDNPRGQDAFVLEGVRAAIAKAKGGAR